VPRRHDRRCDRSRPASGAEVGRLDQSFFGEDRLADHLVRAAGEYLPLNETVRHLSDSVIRFTDDSLRDDATMLLIEWRGATG
jgi:hypothetical protein